MAGSQVSRSTVCFGVLIVVISSSAFPYQDMYDPANNAHEFNNYMDFDDRGQLIKSSDASSGGDSSNEYVPWSRPPPTDPGGGGGGVVPTAAPPVTVGPEPPVNTEPNPPTIGPPVVTGCRGDTCPQETPAVAPRAAAPGNPVKPVAKTNSPKIFTIANNIAKSRGGPLGLSFPSLVAAVSVGGILLVSSVALIAFVCARRR